MATERATDCAAIAQVVLRATIVTVATANAWGEMERDAINLICLEEASLLVLLLSIHVKTTYYTLENSNK